MFEIDVVGSDSDSDCDIPRFCIPAFKKKLSSNHQEPETNSSKKRNNFKKITLSSSLDAGPNYNKSHYVNADSKVHSIKEQAQRQKENVKKMLDEKLKKSIVCQPGFEKLEKVPTFLSRRQMKKQSKREREKTKGYQWYNMPAPEMTEEKKNDLLVVQMRQALDPKRFYKRSATMADPKYFQVGTFVESPVEFFSSRIPKKQRKQTLVDELMDDVEFRKNQKKKVAEFEASRPAKFQRHKKVKKTRLLEAKANFKKNSAISKKPRKQKAKS